MPPQGPVGVEAGGVDNVVTALQETISNLRRSVNEIDSSAQAVVKGWKGDSHDEFVKVAEAWNTEATALNQKFDRFNEAIDSGKSTIVSMDQGGLSGGGSAGGPAPTTTLHT
ncbi:WXG100 family type VII secretion target [Nocardia sp. XZ_19_231]|uniref:WXG100 family type VII secretion target n=1 Tax=Nocardia sp. XZ_19_231 TaxID=2769252 RepID=UPI00188F14FF|nr:WXG100 family type VII secretion target [Nocardia sp. XZ_19_231]